MRTLVKFDPDQADKLMRKLREKEKYMKQALMKIERLVVDTANQNWEGLSKKEYISVYSRSSEQVLEFLKKWLEAVAVFMNDAKLEKIRLEEESAQNLRQVKSAFDTSM